MYFNHENCRVFVQKNVSKIGSLLIESYVLKFKDFLQTDDQLQKQKIWLISFVFKSLLDYMQLYKITQTPTHCLLSLSMFKSCIADQDSKSMF